jgi:hypothetical protein
MDILLDTATWDLPHRPTLGTGISAIMQRVAVRLRTFKGEWFVNTSAGLDYLGWTQQKPLRVQEVSAAVRAEVETTPGVDRTEEWTAIFDRDERKLTIAARVYTSDGVATLRIEPVAKPSSGHVRALVIWALLGVVP